LPDASCEWLEASCESLEAKFDPPEAIQKVTGRSL
jgi:hypothetical protein